MDNSKLYISKANIAHANTAKMPIEIWAALGLLFMAICGLAFAVYKSGAPLDQSGWALISGAIILTIIVCVGSFVLSDKLRRDNQAIPLEAVFSEHGTAFLVTQGERPVAANKSYLDLFGPNIANQSLEAGTIPHIDDLFRANIKDVRKSLYRLHNLRPDSAADTAELYYNTPDGERQRVELRVSGLGQAKLWELTPIKAADRRGSLFETAPVGLMSVTAQGNILTMNAALKSWLGEALNGAKHIDEILEDPEIALSGQAQAGRKLRAETGLKTTGGAVLPVVLGVNWAQQPDDQTIAVMSVYGHSNISKSAVVNAGGEAASMAAFGGLNQTDSPMAAIEIDSADLQKASVLRTNKAFETLFGQADVRGRALSELVDLSGAQDSEAMIETRLNNEGQTHVSIYAAPNHALKGGAWLYLVDISARRSLETQLTQSQKMQAIGQLAAGVAHDFNNLLQAVRLNTDDLLGRHPIGDPSYPELQKINSTVTRAAVLVRKLLAFSRQQTLRPIVLNVGEALSDIMIVLRQVMVERVKLDIVYGRGVPDILADKSQLETVLMNLCVNARDAMIEKGGGQITISTDRLDRSEIDDPALGQSLTDLSSDKLAVISVADNGSGMPQEVMDKIFEPFFTTKEQGKGTGLGLATVYGIVQQSGGHLTVESTVGVGTTFRLYFPEVSEEKARAAAEAAARMPAKEEKRMPSDLAGQGNILFVEDEDNVRIIAAKTLRKRGYNVLEACDGEEALELLDDAESPFDLLISDVVMPGVDGPTLLKRGKEKLGEARIVFISGYAQEDFSELLAEYPDVSFLPKPFTLTQLAEKVKQEIGEATV